MCMQCMYRIYVQVIEIYRLVCIGICAYSTYCAYEHSKKMKCKHIHAEQPSKQSYTINTYMGTSKRIRAHNTSWNENDRQYTCIYFICRCFCCCCWYFSRATAKETESSSTLTLVQRIQVHSIRWVCACVCIDAYVYGFVEVRSLLLSRSLSSSISFLLSSRQWSSWSNRSVRAFVFVYMHVCVCMCERERELVRLGISINAKIFVKRWPPM